jgi:hypothetical protein
MNALDKAQAMQARDDRAAEALARATQSPALTNYPAIYAGFMERGIPESDIEPRVNVFTYNAWLALGRQVRKGEHGVRVSTFVTGSKVDKDTGEARGFKFARTVSVFHVSQTDAIAAQVAA